MMRRAAAACTIRAKAMPMFCANDAAPRYAETALRDAVRCVSACRCCRHAMTYAIYFAAFSRLTLCLFLCCQMLARNACSAPFCLSRHIERAAAHFHDATPPLVAAIDAAADFFAAVMPLAAIRRRRLRHATLLATLPPLLLLILFDDGRHRLRCAACAITLIEPLSPFAAAAALRQPCAADADTPLPPCRVTMPIIFRFFRC